METEFCTQYVDSGLTLYVDSDPTAPVLVPSAVAKEKVSFSVSLPKAKFPAYLENR